MQSGVPSSHALLPALPPSSSMHTDSSNSSGLAAAEGYTNQQYQHPWPPPASASAGLPVSPHHAPLQQHQPVLVSHPIASGPVTTAPAVLPASAVYGSGSSSSRQIVSVSQGLPVKSDPPKPRGRSGPKSKFSPFIGVSQYKRTGRWEAHIWDSSSSTRGSRASSGKAGKGKQLHLGSFLTAAQAARAYDRAALLLRGPHAALNFALEDYSNDPVLEELSRMSRTDLVLALRKTCDMELEAAALEAFNAKVPAAAAHILQNITGPQTSDPGSTAAAAAAADGDISSSMAVDQQLYAFDDVYGSALDNSNWPPAVPVTTALQFNSTSNMQQQPYDETLAPAFSFPVAAARVQQQQQQVWLQQQVSVACPVLPLHMASSSPSSQAAAAAAVGAWASTSGPWADQHQQLYTPGDDLQSAGALQLNSSAQPSPFASQTHNSVLTIPTALQQQQQQQLPVHLSSHSSAPLILPGLAVQQQQQQQQQAHAAGDIRPLGLVNVGSAPVGSVGRLLTDSTNHHQQHPQQHQQQQQQHVEMTTPSLHPASSNTPLLFDAAEHHQGHAGHQLLSGWQQQQQSWVPGTARLAPSGSAPHMPSGYGQLSGPQSSHQDHLLLSYSCQPRELSTAAMLHTTPVVMHKLSEPVVGTGGNKQQQGSRPATPNTTPTHHHQQQRQQQDFFHHTASFPGLLHADSPRPVNVPQMASAYNTSSAVGSISVHVQANSAAAAAAAAGHMSISGVPAAAIAGPSSWHTASPCLRGDSSTSSSGPSNGGSSNTSGSREQQLLVNQHQHAGNNYQQQLFLQQQQHSTGLNRCSVSGELSPAAACTPVSSAAQMVPAPHATASQQQQQQQATPVGGTADTVATAAVVRGQLSQGNLVPTTTTIATASAGPAVATSSNSMLQGPDSQTAGPILQQQRQHQVQLTRQSMATVGHPHTQPHWKSSSEDGNSGSHSSAATAAAQTVAHRTSAAVLDVTLEEGLINRRSTAGSNTGGCSFSPSSPTSAPDSTSSHQQQQEAGRTCVCVRMQPQLQQELQTSVTAVRCEGRSHIECSGFWQHSQIQQQQWVPGCSGLSDDAVHAASTDHEPAAAAAPAEPSPHPAAAAAAAGESDSSRQQHLGAAAAAAAAVSPQHLANIGEVSDDWVQLIDMNPHTLNPDEPSNIGPQAGLPQASCRLDSTGSKMILESLNKQQQQQGNQASGRDTASVKYAAAAAAAAAATAGGVLKLRPAATRPDPLSSKADEVAEAAAAAEADQRQHQGPAAVALEQSKHLSTPSAAPAAAPSRTMSNLTISDSLDRLGPSRTVSSLVLAELARLASSSGSGEHDAATSELVLQEGQHLLFSQNSLFGLDPDKLDLLLMTSGSVQVSCYEQLQTAGAFEGRSLTVQQAQQQEHEKQANKVAAAAAAGLTEEEAATMAAAATVDAAAVIFATSCEKPVSNVQVSASSKRGINHEVEGISIEVEVPAAKRPRSPAPTAASSGMGVQAGGPSTAVAVSPVRCPVHVPQVALTVRDNATCIRGKVTLKHQQSQQQQHLQQFTKVSLLAGGR